MTHSFEHPKLSLKVPKHLKHHFIKLENLKRFVHKEFPKNVFHDNAMIHTIRCVNRASTLKSLNTSRILKILFIHDIPELITGEVDVIRKKDNSLLNSKLTEAEEKASKDILSKSEQTLLKEFNYADTFLKGEEGHESDLSLEALIAKIIDSLDGNLGYHYFLSKWIKSPQYDSEKLPPDRAGLHAFNNRKTYTKNLTKIEKMPTTLLLQLMDKTISDIRELWSKVPSKRVPPSIKRNLDSI